MLDVGLSMRLQTEENEVQDQTFVVCAMKRHECDVTDAYTSQRQCYEIPN